MSICTDMQRSFATRVCGRIERQEIRHLSVFALAPQPLLVELGRLLCDIVPMVYPAINAQVRVLAQSRSHD
ncbi:hypothetical protein FHS95_000323 [Sphingomonas naasensis]|uniref:hypothetical protein n=1 Tax=Sphingomonas naasensis TaxID=1344951 RepID=UPI0019D2EBAE|nr:hypothetical protein [Sphingomonas naasensis]NIJ18654.1 hypothetical protein [Sphingomonas naasensis]